MIVAMGALNKKFDLKELVVASYQAASGAGQSGIDTLRAQISAVAGTNSGDVANDSKAHIKENGPFPKPLALNVIPWAGSLKEAGYSSEELPYTKCLQCQTQVVSDDNAMKCFRCASFLHQECGTTYKPLEDHDVDETILCCCKKCASTETITLCTNCAVQLKANSHRLRVKPTNDFNLGVSFSQKLVRKRGNETHLGIPKPKKPKLSAAEEEQERLEKAVQLQHWLTGIVSVKYMKSSKKYVVKSMNNAHEEQKTLDGGFVDDSIPVSYTHLTLPTNREV